ncbi:hypothetical protein GY45DRAFT_465440 [Cubamyces sp. BRFM 1775]|nr:hypothetical protein GY45DRAFT_465440 [Cubamyces sp. BRFM 1775]
MASGSPLLRPTSRRCPRRRAERERRCQRRRLGRDPARRAPFKTGISSQASGTGRGRRGQDVMILASRREKKSHRLWDSGREAGEMGSYVPGPASPAGQRKTRERPGLPIKVCQRAGWSCIYARTCTSPMAYHFLPFSSSSLYSRPYASSYSLRSLTRLRFSAQ